MQYFLHVWLCFVYSSIDEIVLNYLVSILEHLGSGQAVEEDFDVDDFCQMMQAYLPEFDVTDKYVLLV